MRGRGPAPGAPNAGRPPDAFKAMCANLVSSPETQAAITEILKDSTHPGFASVFRAVAPYGYGQPTQALELSGKVEAGVVILPALTPTPPDADGSA